MTRLATNAIAVIIAAHNAKRTIGRAVRSALRERQVVEVIVVDDASPDSTVAAARSADDGSNRLVVISLGENGGPAAARNLALEHCTAPYVAVLDADDFFLEGRFNAMGFASGSAPANCDAVADNIVFASEDTLSEARQLSRNTTGSAGTLLSLEQVISGNISQPNQPRGELGFLKPVLRRAFIEQHGLRYNIGLRLGEDFEFYVRLIALGGRFRVVGSCGYLAVERSNSLSAVHSADDLAALVGADQALLETLTLSAREATALLRHQAHVRDKCDLQRFLDVKRERGLSAALTTFSGEPARLAKVVRGVAADKLRALRPALAAPRRPRMLLQANPL